MRDRQHVYDRLRSLWDETRLKGQGHMKRHLSPDSHGSSGVLATLIRVEGSYYRRPGARALFVPAPGAIDPNHQSGGSQSVVLERVAGVISGGCLEKELLEVAQEVFQTQKPQLFEADLSQPDEPLLGFGTGCPGRVRLLLEPLPSVYPDPRGAAFSAHLLTAYRPQGEAFLEPFHPRDRQDFGSQEIKRVGIIADPQSPLFSTRLLETKGGQVFVGDPQAMGLVPLERAEWDKQEVIWETPLEQPHLVLFGAGDDGAALVDVVLAQGFSVTIIDHRPFWLERSQALHGPRWSQQTCSSPKPQVTWASWDSPQSQPRRGEQDPKTSFFPVSCRDVVVLMTHQLHRDVEILRHLIPIGPRYVGVLGAHKRAELLKAELLPILEQTALKRETTIDRVWSTLRAPMGKAAFFTDDPWQIGLTTACEILASLCSSPLSQHHEVTCP